jgi:hypothetical protein
MEDQSPDVCTSFTVEVVAKWLRKKDDELLTLPVSVMVESSLKYLANARWIVLI